MDICTYALSIHMWSLLSKHLSHTCCVLGMCTLGTPPPRQSCLCSYYLYPQTLPKYVPRYADGHSPCTHRYAYTDHSGVHVIHTQALPCRDQLVFGHMYAQSCGQVHVTGTPVHMYTHTHPPRQGYISGVSVPKDTCAFTVHSLTYKSHLGIALSIEECHPALSAWPSLR